MCPKDPLPDHNVSSSKLPSTDFLDTPITQLPQVAVRRAQLLEKLGIYTVYDLISFFPREYENWSDISKIDALVHGEEGSFVAVVRQKPTLQRKGKISILRTVLSDDTGTIRAVWFNQPYLQQKLEKGQSYFFRGKIRRDGKTFDVTNPVIEADPAAETDDEEQALLDCPIKLRTFYPLTKGLKQGVIRSLIENALPQAIPCVKEPLPVFVRRAEKLSSAGFAYEKIHCPVSLEELEIARKRLIYEELFLVQGGLRWMKLKSKKDEKAFPIILSAANRQQLKQCIRDLPFTLTDDQKKVCGEILQDLERSVPMNRLVQGDVGSGKTVVSAMAILGCALCGRQSVFMAPTSILAQQHFNTLSGFFEKTGVSIALLLGSTPVAQKKKIRQALESGELLVLVGTHAVLSEHNVFSNLALTITDEQHRFGVKQRGSFIDKNQMTPHTLVMSATPIPRTLALILYGDLDISIISTIPAGRPPIETYMATSSDAQRLNGIVTRQVTMGRQVYYVCPLIESSSEEQIEEESGLLSAIDLYTQLSTTVFPDFQVGLIHGGLKANQKELVMEQFLAGEIQILVTTTVIEVGVDNPNASLMIVENADRFGLSQLHQLRGRIGRGPHRSVCILKSDKAQGLAKKRLQTLCSTLDGFKIAQEDLELRGPGDFFGTRQHGIPALRIANLYRDTDVLARVSVALDKIFAQDPYLESPSSGVLLAAVLQRFGSEFNHPSL